MTNPEPAAAESWPLEAFKEDNMERWPRDVNKLSWAIKIHCWLVKNQGVINLPDIIVINSDG